MKSANRYLLWLNWPEGAFRLNARSLAVFKGLVRGEVKMVRSERAFLRALPEATHAVVWEFRREWFARAPHLRVLATPGAGRELLPKDGELPPGVVRVNGTFHGGDDAVLLARRGHEGGDPGLWTRWARDWREA